MLNPGTLFILWRNMGQCLRPRVWRDLNSDWTCTVISGEQASFGTKGAVNRYLLLSPSALLLTAEFTAKDESRLRILAEPT